MTSVIFISFGLFLQTFADDKVVFGGEKIQTSCRTIGGPAQGQKCQFPFFFKGILRDGCVTENDPEVVLGAELLEMERLTKNCTNITIIEGDKMILQLLLVKNTLNTLYWSHNKNDSNPSTVLPRIMKFGRIRIPNKIHIFKNDEYEYYAEFKQELLL